MDVFADLDDIGGDVLGTEGDSRDNSAAASRNSSHNAASGAHGCSQPSSMPPASAATAASIAASNTTGYVTGEIPAHTDGQSHGSTTSDGSSGTAGGTSSGGGLLYGKSPLHTPAPRNSGVLFGKSSSLIFPTGVEPPADAKGESSNLKRHKINLLLDQCETVRFPFKKKLMLNNLHLTASDIPVKDLYGTSLGNSLHKLSLAGNRLSTIPPKLVTCLPVLKTLDLSQCELHQLPEKWNLLQLKRLNLSHNRLTEFPEETMLEGLLELQELNMYGNKVAEIIIPHNPRLLSKLETLNLGYNDLAYIPDDLERLKALRTFKVMNNFLEKVPMRVCDMDLKTIDVSSNPVIQPPIETCERGIGSMKRYYHCLRVEEQAKLKALEAVQTKAVRVHQKHSTNISVGNSSNLLKSHSSGVSLGSSLGSQAKGTTTKASKVMDKVMGFAKPKFIMQTSMSRKTSDDSHSHNSHGHTSSLTPVTSISSPLGSPALDKLQPQAPTPTQDRRSSSAHLGVSSAVSSSEHGTIASIEMSTVQTQPQNAPVGAEVSSSSAPPVTSRRVKGRQSNVDASSKVPTAVSVIRNHSEPESRENGVDFKRVVDLPASSGNASSSSPGVDQVTVNDTLKVIFVGMAMAGKTSMIKRLMEGEDAVIPKRDERTVGVDIYEWDPKKDRRFEHIDSRIALEDKELEETCGDVNVKFSVWDFAGQHVYHATHELFFSQRALYVLVWDMGATNSATLRRKNSREYEQGAFKLSYDSSDEESEEDDDFAWEEEARRADRALDRDIDEKVQFWVDCIQSSAPGAAILPVASFDDIFTADSHEEAIRRCNIMKHRLLKHEERRIKGIKDRLKAYCDQNRANDEGALRLRKLLCSYTRPKLIFGSNEADSVVRVSGTLYTGFATLTERIINIATGRDKGKWRYPIFRGHVGARIPRMRLEVRDAVRTMRDRFKVVEWGYFINQLRDRGLTSVEDISDALHFLTNIGELSYFGGVLPDRGKTMMNPVDDLSNVRGMEDLAWPPCTCAR